MEILGIGPSELIFIVIIAIIVLGPRDMQKAGRTLGKWLRQVVTSDGWKFFQQTSREIQTLPNRLMREAALEELKEMEKELRQPLEPTQSGRESIAAGGGRQNEGLDSSGDREPKILPSPAAPSGSSEDRNPDA